ncbi:MAG: ABC transporter permease [Gemmatimonadaceae bacterium]
MSDSLRTTVRALCRDRAFSLTAVASVALGVTLATTVGAVVNAYLIRSLPFANANRLYHLSYSEPRHPEPRGVRLIDWPALQGIVDLADSTGLVRLHLTGAPWLEEVQGLRTLPHSVQGINFPVAVGRRFTEPDFAPGASPAMLISRKLWIERYHGDSSVIGRFVPLAPADGFADPVRTQIIGVLSQPVRAAEVFERGEVDVIVPLRDNATAYMVRLRPGVTREVAEREINRELRRVATAIPEGWPGVHLESLHDRYTAPVRRVLVGIAAAVALVLAIVLANLGVLSLLRRVRREKELAIRSALGASRRRLASLAVGEGALIVATGTALAVLASWTILRGLAPMIEQRLGRAPSGGAGAIEFDFAVWLAIAGVLALALAALALPAITRGDSRLADALRRTGIAGGDGRGARGARSLLIGSEIAISVVLLVATGLMIANVRTLLGTELGVDPTGVLRARVSVPAQRYATDSAKSQFYDNLGSAVMAARRGGFALTSGTPFYEPGQSFVTRGEGETPGGVRPAVISVTGDYFGVVGIALKAGRNFDGRDAWGAAPVAIVSEGLARRLWPGAAAVGRTLRMASPTAAADSSIGRWRTVIGVVSDVRQGFDDTNLADLYLPFAQAPTQYAQFMACGRDADSVVVAVRRAATAIDRGAMVTFPSRLDDEVSQLLAGPRFIMSLLGAFAAAAVLIAVVGLYGVTAYAVTQRQREVAIRLALGATGDAVMRLLISQGGRVVLAGVVVGVAGALGAGRILAGQLHGVKWFETGTMSGAVAVIMLAAAVAIWWPARRVLGVEPIEALKSE